MTSTVPVNSPVLQLGSQGQAVKDLQILLNKTVAANLKVDGSFGGQTQVAVQTTQSIFFLTIDGIVGEKTWRVLRSNQPIAMPVLKLGNKGDLVRRVQVVLKDTEYYTSKIDGDFGAKTQAAISNLQTARKITVKKLGEIDQPTWEVLVSLAKYFALD
ncbi:MAG TPA: peptidoglycan-binding protein [Chroococcales cyanobacterium]